MFICAITSCILEFFVASDQSVLRVLAAVDYLLIVVVVVEKQSARRHEWDPVEYYQTCFETGSDPYKVLLPVPD